jgi:hypothetical protein
MRTFGRAKGQDPKRLARGRFTPRLESLEARTLPSFTNVLVNNVAQDTTAQDTQSETSLTLAPNGNVVVGFNDSGEDTSSTHFTGYSFSSNGGTSFTDQGALPSSTNGDAGDPVLTTSIKTKHVFLSALSFSASNTLEMFKSTDNGATFGTPVNPVPGAAPSALLDKDWTAIDNFAGPGRGNIYETYTNFATFGFGPSSIRLTRSLDDGATWGPNNGLLISPAHTTVQGSYVVVGPDHSVYVFYLDGTSSTNQKIMVSKSTDQGVTFSAPTVVATLSVTGVNGDLGLNGGFRTNSFPHVAVNPMTGALYVAYNDKGTGSDAADIFFTESTDGGATWSPGVRVNNDSTSNDQWQPDIAVTPDGTKLFMAWYDRRLDPNNSLIDWFGTIGDISGSSVSFRGNGRITTQSFPVVVGQDPVINFTYMGDYDQAVADSRYFYTTWGDNRLSDAAHANNPDVRFNRIPVNFGAGTDSGIVVHGPVTNRGALAAAARSAWGSASSRPVSDVSSSAAAAIWNGNTGGTVTQYQPPVGGQSQDAQAFLLDQYWQSEFQKGHNHS